VSTSKGHIPAHKPAKRLYHDSLYRFDAVEPSYWEATSGELSVESAALSADASCDVAVIGGGYSGLSTAYHLAKDLQADVRVLEAGHIGWGASGRNGGFCSLGGNKLGLAAAVRRYGLDAVRHYWRSQVDAVELVRSLVSEENINAGITGDEELAVACSTRSFAELRAHALDQFTLLQLDASVVSRDEFRERYFDSPLQHGAIRIRPTFGLHPLRLVRGLARAAVTKGAILHARSEVLAWQKSGGVHLLSTAGGTVRAKKVVMAANGFMPEHLHPSFAGRPMPMISAIVVTRPLTESELGAQQWQSHAPMITARRLLNYFRLLPDRRLLFGGRGHSSGGAAGTARNYALLVSQMRQLCPAWRTVPIDYQWQGLVCFTRRLTPAVGRLSDDPSVYFAFGYHGNGVNTSIWAGREIAGWIAGGDQNDAPASIPVMVRGLSGRFPLAAIRLWYLRARLAMMRAADRIDEFRN
jgi:glycine/D-amino acid oxidase-like deaminating enzyme